MHSSKFMRSKRQIPRRNFSAKTKQNASWNKKNGFFNKGMKNDLVSLLGLVD